MNVHSWETLKYPPPTVAGHRVWHFVERHLPNIALFLMVLTLFAAILYPAVVYIVPSGDIGVLWKRFGGGTVLTGTLKEGIHFVMPWDRVFIYSLRVQTANETYNAISRDGVNLNASITIRFQLQKDWVPHLHQAVGPDFISLLVLPDVGNQVRDVISKYTAEEVYSTLRRRIQKEMSEAVQEALHQPLPGFKTDGDEKALEIYDLLLLGIDLPPAVIAAVNRKTDQFYISQEYDFRLQREEKEARRKQIEAQGIRDFQDTVSHGISDSYLRWRGIEATLQLAQSPNSKVVIIGSNKDGLPIILGNVDSPANALPAPPPGPTQQTPALPPNSPEHAPSPQAAATTSPSPASAALSAASPGLAGEVLQSPAAVASQVREAARPAGVNVPQDVAPAANLATPSTATPEVHHAFVPPVAPAKREDSESGAIHPAVPETTPPQRITPWTRFFQPPP